MWTSGNCATKKQKLTLPIKNFWVFVKCQATWQQRTKWTNWIFLVWCENFRENLTEMKNLWIKQYLSKIKHNSKLVDLMSQLFTTNVMAEESKYFLFSLSVGLCRCMFNEATKIMQLSYNSSCDFSWFLLKIFLQNVAWQKWSLSASVAYLLVFTVHWDKHTWI